MMGGGIVGGMVGYGEMSVETKQKLTTSASSDAKLVGPGKGDVFYGTGFEIALEKIRRLTFDVSDTNNIVPALFDTVGYNIVGTEGSFQYTAYQLKNIVNDLKQAYKTAKAAGDSTVADSLLHNVREYEKILLADAGLDNSIEGDDVEQLSEKSIHFGGTTKFDKSLTTAISDQYKISHSVKLSAAASSGLKIKLGACYIIFKFFHSRISNR